MQFIQFILGKLLARKGQFIAAGKVLSVSVLNQVVSSGTNFALGIYLVRILTPAEFGLYGIGFAISLFYAGIGNALFLTQMVVHTPDKSPDDRESYAARTLIAVTFFCAISLLLSTLLFLIGGKSFIFIQENIQFASAVVLFSISNLMKEFFVRYAYNCRREIWALSINTILAVVMAIAFMILSYLQVPFNVELALFIYALSNSIAFLSGYYLSRINMKEVSIFMVNRDIREAWRGGAYSVIAHIIITIRMQAHTIILASTLSTAAVGVVNAARIFVSPIFILMPSFTQILLPRLCEARSMMKDKGKGKILMYSSIMAIFVLIYSGLLLFFYDEVHNLLLGKKYESLYLLVVVWCLCALLSTIKTGLEISMIAQKYFKEQAYVNLVGAIVSLASVYSLSVYYGNVGAVSGLAIAELAVIFAILASGFMGAK